MPNRRNLSVPILILLFVFVFFVFIFSSGLPTTKQDETDTWTVMVLMDGEYENMRDKLISAGVSDNVNVVVLHLHNELTAYQINPNHPDSADIALSEMGIEEDKFSTEVLKRFFLYVQTHFSASRYLLSLRGDARGSKFLGITVVHLGEALEQFVQTNNNKKIDVINLGFCLSGLIDNMYSLAPYATYFVGSINTTNTPVSIRWRIYRWIKNIIKNPNLSAEELASSIVDIFSLQTSWCLEQNHQCSNADQEQPWAVSAIDLSKVKGIADAIRELACYIYQEFSTYRYDFINALNSSTSVGYYTRTDLQGFAENLAQNAAHEPIRQAAKIIVKRIEEAVVNVAWEEGSVCNNEVCFPKGVHGISSFSNYIEHLLGPSQMGNYQLDSLWRLLTDLKKDGDGVLPEITGMAIEPEDLVLQVNESATLNVRTQSERYKSMCLTEVAWEVENPNIGQILDVSQNPAQFNALYMGGTVVMARSDKWNDVKLLVTVLEAPRNDPISLSNSNSVSETEQDISDGSFDKHNIEDDTYVAGGCASVLLINRLWWWAVIGVFIYRKRREGTAWFRYGLLNR